MASPHESQSSSREPSPEPHSNAEENSNNPSPASAPASQDEQAPLPSESAPPLPDEAPPLPNEDAPPPLPTEQPPPLPAETAPPLPAEQPPLPAEAPPDDGWAPVWDDNARAFYFHNRFTGATQWDNPRVPDTGVLGTTPAVTAGAVAGGAPSSTAAPPLGLALGGEHGKVAETGWDDAAPTERKSNGGGYNPAIHGDFDPDADYAQAYADSDDEAAQPHTDLPNPHGSGGGDGYAATGAFNRFTGRFQDAGVTPENHNDESKSRRQMNAFFDVDAAANSHDGRSLRAERQGKKFSKKEIKAFKEKRRERKEEKRRAWLRD